MSIIAKPNTFSPSTTASSSAVNDNFDTIYDEFNGNIGAANIVDGAVTTAKIVDSSVSTAKLADGAVTEAKYDTASSPITRADEMTFDFVASGGVWSGDAYGSTRNASMTALVCYINGQRGTISAVTARSFTASRDTYVDVLNSSGTFSLVYTEVTNNAASPALASNSIRIGIIVTGASNIANVAAINQGQEDRVLPIASSIAYSVSDSLGNMICNRDPKASFRAQNQILSISSNISATSATQVTGMSARVLFLAQDVGKKFTIKAYSRDIQQNTGAAYAQFTIWAGTVGSGTQLQSSQTYASGVNLGQPSSPDATYTCTTAGLVTFNAGLQTSNGANSVFVEAASTYPAYIRVIG